MRKIILLIIAFIPLIAFCQSGGTRSLKIKSAKIVHSDITGDNAEALAQKAKAQIEERKEPVAESLPDTERTASVEEIEEIIKEAAYAMTEEVLGSMGISARDYIMAKVADEDVADSIEKRASVVSEISGTTVLRAADDLLSEITARLSDNQ